MTAHPDLRKLADLEIAPLESWGASENALRTIAARLADALTVAVCEMVATGLEGEAGEREEMCKRHGWQTSKMAVAAREYAARVRAGEWTAHQKAEPFDAERFVGLVEALGAGADFVVAPDIVCGGLASLRLSESWLPRLAGIGGMRLVPVQDGMEPADARGLLGPEVGIFVGGGDPWKEHSMQKWGALSREVGCHLHVGRVNSTRRIRLCALAGAHSFDGSGPSRFSVETPRLDRRRRSLLPFGGVPCEP